MKASSYLAFFGGRGEKVKQKHQFVVTLTYSFIGCLYMPWAEVEPEMAYQDYAVANWATEPGLYLAFYNLTVDL